jgi:hypothetical protein
VPVLQLSVLIAVLVWGEVIKGTLAPILQHDHLLGTLWSTWLSTPKATRQEAQKCLMSSGQLLPIIGLARP